MRKGILIIWTICVWLVLCACAVTENESSVVPTQSAESLPEVSAEPSAKSVQTPAPLPEATPVPVKGNVTVRGGDTLERDIIPQLCSVFSVTQDDAKEALSAAQSRLISDELSGFRRMEGVIVPGRYDVTDQTLEDYIALWIIGAEQRYDGLAAASGDANNKSAPERLALASIVDWECLSDTYQAEAAAVLMNRLRKGDKLQCCATVEYALGYSRPYLTSDDIKIESEYNTYTHKGLPPGPICAVDDASLSAAIGNPVDTSLYFFFYDYVPATMQVFSDYGTFKEKAAVSKQMFVDTYDIGKYDIVDKRSYFIGAD